MKASILINAVTGELDGSTVVSIDSDIDFVQPTATHDVLRIAPDHPALYEQRKWEAPTRMILNAPWGRELRLKSHDQLTREEQESAAQHKWTMGKSMTEVLLKLINEERLANGRAALTLADAERRRRETV